MQPAGNHYATLGLDRDCSTAQVRAAYRALAKKHHPDVHPSSAQATARIQALNKDFGTDVLVSAAVYDALGGEVPARALPPVSVRGKAAPLEIYALEGAPLTLPPA